MLVHGQLLAPEPQGHVAVAVEDGRITAVTPISASANVPAGALGGPGATITPGLVDIQVNGAFGQDLSDPTADVAAVCAGLPRFGVTAYLACVITSPVERYGPGLDHLAAAMRTSSPGARLLGVHLEGPFLSPRRAGTHTPEWLIAPSAALMETWIERAPVKVVTLAPELPGAIDLIRQLVARGVIVAMGHTDATWDEAAAAAAAGARLGTHLFNAMRPLHHREPGTIGFLLASDLAVSVVAEGHHVDTRILGLVGRLKSPDRLVVVTDALAGLGMPPGRFELAGVDIVSDGTIGRRTDGTLSGSVGGLDRSISVLIEAGLSAEDAIRAATINPARLLGLEATMGRVAVGRGADLVVFGADWTVDATIVGGRIAYRRDAGFSVTSTRLEIGAAVSPGEAAR
ncbi:MAG: N-acetylglucosamine-6-phosphate deacetylase [Chloroflexota bacterium]